MSSKDVRDSDSVYGPDRRAPEAGRWGLHRTLPSQSPARVHGEQQESGADVTGSSSEALILSGSNHVFVSASQTPNELHTDPRI